MIRLRVWSLETGETVRIVDTGMKQICDVAVTPDGTRADEAGWHEGGTIESYRHLARLSQN